MQSSKFPFAFEWRLPPQDYFYLSDLTSHPTQQQLLCGVATAFVSCSEPINSADSTVHCICLNPTSPLLPRKSLSLAKRLGVILAPPPLFRTAELNITSLKTTSQVFSTWSVSLVAHAFNLICQLQSSPASVITHTFTVFCVCMSLVPVFAAPCRGVECRPYRAAYSKCILWPLGYMCTAQAIAQQANKYIYWIYHYPSSRPLICLSPWRSFVWHPWLSFAICRCIALSTLALKNAVKTVTNLIFVQITVISMNYKFCLTRLLSSLNQNSFL